MFHYFTIRPGVLNDGFLVSGLVFGCQGVPVLLSSITDSKARILDSPSKNSLIPESGFPYIVLGAANMYILH